MKAIDIVILTDQTHVLQYNEHGEINLGYLEDQLLQESLENKGFSVSHLAWDDADFDWSSAKYLIFRSTWDYFYRFPEFLKWLEQVSEKTTLINSKQLIYWNLDKHYLNDLQKKGIHIAASYFIEKGSKTSLIELHQSLQWPETVLKPCISGTARHTYRLSESILDEYEAIFQQLIQNEAMMLQPFQSNIVEKGEISMMLVDGKFTHAVIKTAKPGDFRVQDDFGGKVSPYEATSEEISFAESAISACPELPIYGRVDIFTDNEGHIALSELELIEPELWFRFFPQASEILAKAIKVKLSS